MVLANQNAKLTAQTRIFSSPPLSSHESPIGKRLGSCIGIKLLRGYKWLIPTFEAMVIVLVDMVEECIENQTQCTWIIFKASGHIRVPTVHG